MNINDCVCRYFALMEMIGHGYTGISIIHSLIYTFTLDILITKYGILGIIASDWYNRICGFVFRQVKPTDSVMVIRQRKILNEMSSRIRYQYNC